MSSFNGQIDLTFAAGIPSGVSVTPAGGNATAYTITPPPVAPATTTIAAGGTIPISPGVYYLTAGATYALSASLYPSANWTLHGNGATITGGTAGSTLIVFANPNCRADNIVFTTASGNPLPNAIEIDAANCAATNCTGQSVSDFVLVNIGGAGALISGCTCPQPNQYATFVNGAPNVVITGNKFGDPVAEVGSQVQHLIRGGGPGLQITDNILFQPLLAGGSERNAIDIQLPGACTITGNTIGKAGVESGGLWLGPLESSWAATGPTTVSGNTILSTYTYLMGPSSNITISGNTFNRVNLAAISINPGVSDVIISGNTWVDSGPAGQFVVGAAGCSNVTLEGNIAQASINLTGAVPGESGLADWYEAGNYWFATMSSLVSSANNQWSTSVNGDVAGWSGANGSQTAITREAHLQSWPTDSFIAAAA